MPAAVEDMAVGAAEGSEAAGTAVGAAVAGEVAVGEASAVAAADTAVVVAVAAAGGTSRIGKVKRMRTMLLPVALAILGAGAVAVRASEPGTQERFKSPSAAMQALVAAARSNDTAKLLAILGPDAEAVVSSGDAVDDANDRSRFVARATERTRFESLPDGATIAQIGRQATPFAIPLVKDGEQWRFDTAAGKDELLNRRIGRNELMAIAAAHAYVDAQEEYARMRAAQGDDQAYAEKFRSAPGQRDGLYWEAASGTEESPLGPLFASASAEGYQLTDQTTAPQPYHGYFYRILTGQGANATGGARSYVKDGKMTGGFGLVAWPAEYGQSGIMTFLVNRQGIVFQRDLGAQTGEVVKAMTTYDPDASWTPTR